MSARSDERASVATTGGWMPRSEKTSTAAARNDAAFRPNGNAAASTKSHAPNGLATNWLITVKIAPKRESAVGSRSGATIAGTKAAEAVSASVSPVPRTKKTAYTSGIDTKPSAIDRASTPMATARPR